MKKLLLTLMMGAALVLPSAAMASSLTAEVRFADLRNNIDIDSTEYKIEFNDTAFNNAVNYGFEASTKETDHNGFSTKLSAKLGPSLPKVWGFTPKVYGEIGENLSSNRNFTFWGAGASVSHDIYGPVSMQVGYRHRQDLGSFVKMNEERVNVGLQYAFNDKNSVGVQYYRTSGTSRSDAIGVAYTRKF